MQPKPPFLAVPLKHGDPRKRNWLCGIDRGYAPRRIAPSLIAAHMLRRHGERPQSSPGPKPRPCRPPATTCPPTQTPVLFSISLTQLLARRVLLATQNFLTLNPLKTLPTPTLLTSAYTSLNKLPGSLVVKNLKV